MARARRLPRGITRSTDRPGFLVQVTLRKHRRSARFTLGTTLEEMRDWQDEQRRELRRLVPANDRRKIGTFTSDVETYLARWHSDTVHKETKAQREWYLRLWAAHFGERRRHSITTREIAEQLAYWRDHGLPQRPITPSGRRRREPPTTLAPATVAKVRQAIFQLYRLLDRGTGRANPVADVELPPLAPLEPRGVPMTMVDAIFQVMPAGKSRDRLQLMAYAGLRPIEIARLVASDFTDGDPALLHVRTAKGGPGATLPLLPEAREAVVRLIAANALGPFGSAPVGRVLHTACAAVTKARDLHPALRLRPYDLRHSFGSAVLAAADQRTAQAALRHASIQTTHRYTLQAVPERVRTALRAIDGRKPAPPKTETRTA